MSSFVSSALLVLAALTPLSAHASFEDLGVLPGGDYFLSQALSVSGDGNVVVGSGSIVNVGDEFTSIDDQAIRWENGVLTSMKPLVVGHDRSVARGVSADGSVITGTVYRWGGYPSGGFVWADGAVSFLGDLSGGSIWSNGHDVSGDGTVIAGFSVDAVTDRAIAWVSGAMSNLGTGTGWSYAEGVSADGSTIVGYQQIDGAKRWVNGEGSILAPPPGDFGTQAHGVSADGRTIVGRSLQSQGNAAVRWVDGVPELLGTLPGHLQSIANDVSGDGSIVVGFSADPSGSRTAVVWDEAHGMRSLRAVLLGQSDPVAGWTLREAHAISDAGTVIVGTGVNPSGYERGFIARIDVPEPALGSTLGCGLLLVIQMASGRRPLHPPHRDGGARSA